MGSVYRRTHRYKVPCSPANVSVGSERSCHESIRALRSQGTAFGAGEPGSLVGEPGNPRPTVWGGDLSASSCGEGTERIFGLYTSASG